MREGGSFKRERLQQLIKNEVNSFLRSSFNNKYLTFVSITHVELTTDLKEAKLYWDTYNSSVLGQTKSALLKCRGKIRSHLAKTITTRNAPTIQLIYDSQFESEQAIVNILKRESSLGKSY